MPAHGFFGAHEGERILHVIKLHWVASLFYWLGLGGTMSGMAFLIHELSLEVPEITDDLQFYGRICSAVVCGVGGFWGWRLQSGYLTFVTDRRIVRFRPSFPFFHSRRMVYWSEAMKAKSINGSFLLRCCGIGTIRVMPFTSQEQDVAIDWVGQFEELVNYMDRLIYVTKREPHKLTQVKTFIPNACFDYPVEVLDEEEVADTAWDSSVVYAGDGTQFYASPELLGFEGEPDDDTGWRAVASDSYPPRRRRRKASNGY